MGNDAVALSEIEETHSGRDVGDDEVDGIVRGTSGGHGRVRATAVGVEIEDVLADSGSELLGGGNGDDA